MIQVKSNTGDEWFINKQIVWRDRSDDLFEVANGTDNRPVIFFGGLGMVVWVILLIIMPEYIPLYVPFIVTFVLTIPVIAWILNRDWVITASSDGQHWESHINGYLTARRLEKQAIRGIQVIGYPQALTRV